MIFFGGGFWGGGAGDHIYTYIAFIYCTLTDISRHISYSKSVNTGGQAPLPVYTRDYL